MAAHVLLIDDDEQLLPLMEDYFASLGYEVHAVREREQAETFLSHFDYQLVITDISLTQVGTEGVDLLKVIRDLQERSVIIVLTGRDLPEFKQAALERGADAFFGKTNSLRAVADCARTLLEARL
jgi:two-component system OmpR family response regulator